MHDQVCWRWQCKALDMFDRRLHEILSDRRASECNALKAKQTNCMLIHAGKKINLRQPDIAQADPGHYNTQYQGSRPCGFRQEYFFHISLYDIHIDFL